MTGVTAVVRKLRRERPEPTVAAIEACLGLSLRRIGQGAFRSVYHVGTLPIVVKIPLPSKSKEGIRCNRDHSRREAAKYEKLRRFPLLRPSLPRVYFHDPKTSLLIIEYIEPTGYKNKVSPTERKLVASNILMEKLIKSLTGVAVSDIVENNLSVRNRRLMFLDLGL